jgi:chromosome segregation ATPase
VTGMLDMDKDICNIWKISKEDADKTIKHHENEIQRLENDREKFGSNIIDTRKKLDEANSMIERKRSEGKDVSKLVDAPRFYEINIKNYEKRIGDIDARIAASRDILHEENERAVLAIPRVNEYCTV